MDYALQLLIIVAAAAYLAVWLRDRYHLPAWGVIAIVFAGCILGLLVMFQRLQHEMGRKPQPPPEPEQTETQTDDPPHPPA